MSTTKDTSGTDEVCNSTTAHVRSGVAPYLVVRDADAAAKFYERAFGAVEAFRVPADPKGRHMHIHLYINGASVMLCDHFEEHAGHELRPPHGFTLHLQVADIDAWWKRALDAGVEVGMPLQVMFWGDRYGDVTDPFGVRWSMGAKVSP